MSTGEDPARREVGHVVELAAQEASSVGMPLGMWAGRGDYAKFDQGFRDKAGWRALAELDAAIVHLREARDLLAAAVDKQGSSE